jgi:hypothetical protein
VLQWHCQDDERQHVGKKVAEGAVDADGAEQTPPLANSNGRLIPASESRIEQQRQQQEWSQRDNNNLQAFAKARMTLAYCRLLLHLLLLSPAASRLPAHNSFCLKAPHITAAQGC